MEKKKKRNLLEDLWLFFSLSMFFVLVFSAVVLYCIPDDEVVSFLHWEFLDFEKEEWESIHIISGLFVIIYTLHHLLLKKKLFFLLKRFKDRSYLCQVIVPVIFLTGVVVYLSGERIFPFNIFHFLEEKAIKEQYPKPPIGYIERLPLGIVVEIMYKKDNKFNRKVSLNDVKEELKKIGYSGKVRWDTTLLDVARDVKKSCFYVWKRFNEDGFFIDKRIENVYKEHCKEDEDEEEENE